MAKISDLDEKVLFSSVLRLKSKVFGLVLGLLCGSAIFIATNWLLLKGGHETETGAYVVGPHLELLGQFFPGYHVSFMGSVIGFLYGFACGTIAGSAVGAIYNVIVNRRN